MIDTLTSGLTASFDDLVRDTPRTGVAAMRVKVLLAKVGAVGGAALEDIGPMKDTIALGFDKPPIVVTIESTDAGFKSEDCGVWNKVQ